MDKAIERWRIFMTNLFLLLFTIATATNHDVIGAVIFGIFWALELIFGVIYLVGEKKSRKIIERR